MVSVADAFGSVDAVVLGGPSDALLAGLEPFEFVGVIGDLPSSSIREDRWYIFHARGEWRIRSGKGLGLNGVAVERVGAELKLKDGFVSGVAGLSGVLAGAECWNHKGRKVTQLWDVVSDRGMLRSKVMMVPVESQHHAKDLDYVNLVDLISRKAG